MKSSQKLGVHNGCRNGEGCGRLMQWLVLFSHGFICNIKKQRSEQGWEG